MAQERASQFALTWMEPQLFLTVAAMTLFVLEQIKDNVILMAEE